MKDKIAKLIDVKSIVTIALTAVFGYLSIKGKIDAEQFMLVFTTVIAFYFGRKLGKDESEKEDKP